MKARLTAVAVAVLALCAGVTPAQARLMKWIECRELLGGSDLIVVASPVSKTAETAERTHFDDICAQRSDGSCVPTPAIGVETSFKVIQVLKGDQGLKQFTLHHYREAPETTTGKPPVEISGPETVWFDPTRSKTAMFALLFLVKESDGRYAPYGGQTDPGFYAVFSLRQSSGLATCQTGGGEPRCTLTVSTVADAECGPHFPA
jgi:hypothetical protein